MIRSNCEKKYYNLYDSINRSETNPIYIISTIHKYIKDCGRNEQLIELDKLAKSTIGEIKYERVINNKHNKDDFYSAFLFRETYYTEIKNRLFSGMSYKNKAIYYSENYLPYCLTFLTGFAVSKLLRKHNLKSKI